MLRIFGLNSGEYGGSKVRDHNQTLDQFVGEGKMTQETLGSWDGSEITINPGKFVINVTREGIIGNTGSHDSFKAVVEVLTPEVISATEDGVLIAKIENHAIQNSITSETQASVEFVKADDVASVRDNTDFQIVSLGVIQGGAYSDASTPQIEWWGDVSTNGIDMKGGYIVNHMKDESPDGFVSREDMIDLITKSGGGFVLQVSKPYPFAPRNLRWSDILNDGSYQIYRNNVLINTVDHLTSEYSDTDIVSGNQTYYVKAVSASNVNTESNHVTVTSVTFSAIDNYGDGSDGAYIDSGNLQRGRIYNFTEFTLDTFMTFDGSGTTFVLVDGPMTVSANGTISGNLGERDLLQDVSIFGNTVNVQPGGGEGGNGGDGGQQGGVAGYRPPDPVPADHLSGPGGTPNGPRAGNGGRGGNGGINDPQLATTSGIGGTGGGIGGLNYFQGTVIFVVSGDVTMHDDARIIGHGGDGTDGSDGGNATNWTLVPRPPFDTSYVGGGGGGGAGGNGGANGMMTWIFHGANFSNNGIDYLADGGQGGEGGIGGYGGRSQSGVDGYSLPVGRGGLRGNAGESGDPGAPGALFRVPIV